MALAKAAIRMELTKLDGSKVNLNQAVDSLTAFVETKDLDFGDPRVPKFVDTVLLKIANAAGIGTGGTLTVKYRETLGGPLLTGDTVALDPNSGPLHVRLPDAPWIRFRIQDTAIQTLWQLSGMEAWGSAEGEDF